ncbi:MAG TPA: hypothetical protein VFT63_04665 [bacterium]|nr:hypothetical protein [bacterium]
MLPDDLDAAAANAVYNNGVLVVILPIGGDQSDDTIRMSKVGSTRGRRVRHTGYVGSCPQKLWWTAEGELYMVANYCARRQKTVHFPRGSARGRVPMAKKKGKKKK